MEDIKKWCRSNRYEIKDTMKMIGSGVAISLIANGLISLGRKIVK